MALRALCIGINDYPGTGSDLSGCVNDANDWAAELERRGFEVARLLNRQATGDRIRKGIGELVASGRRGDTIVVQFSGHGSYVPDADGDEPDGADECLCPTDTRNGYITDDELFELYARRENGVHIVTIADSCHSGTIARFAAAASLADAVGPDRARKVRFLPPASFLRAGDVRALGGSRRVRPASAPGRRAGLTLSGCQDAEYSYDGYFRGRPNGVFSYVALEALKSLPEGTTYAQWFAAIRRKLPSQQYPQTPALSGPPAMKKMPALGG